MAAQPDLWGDLEVQELKSPVSILRKQAALLGSKTQNLVEARVETHISYGRFVHSFNLIVPVLDYTYQLFAVEHGPEIYPFYVGETRAENENEFRRWLQEKLSSPETKRIVSNLLSQVA